MLLNRLDGHNRYGPGLMIGVTYVRYGGQSRALGIGFASLSPVVFHEFRQGSCLFCFAVLTLFQCPVGCWRHKQYMTTRAHDTKTLSQKWLRLAYTFSRHSVLLLEAPTKLFLR